MQGQSATVTRVVKVKMACPPGQKYCSNTDQACSQVCTTDLVSQNEADYVDPAANTAPQVRHLWAPSICPVPHDIQ
jgi:hypothetical protein